MKKLYIKKGTKTSFQYHKKVETNYLLDGTIEVWFENVTGIVEKNFKSRIYLVYTCWC